MRSGLSPTDSTSQHSSCAKVTLFAPPLAKHTTTAPRPVAPLPSPQPLAALGQYSCPDIAADETGARQPPGAPTVAPRHKPAKPSPVEPSRKWPCPRPAPFHSPRYSPGGAAPQLD